MPTTVMVDCMAEDGYTAGAAGVGIGLSPVEAHGMLNSLSVARATVSTLRLHWGKIDEARCLSLLERAEEQLEFLSESLGDLVRGIPQETRAFLDDLRQAR